MKLIINLTNQRVYYSGLIPTDIHPEAIKDSASESSNKDIGDSSDGTSVKSSWVMLYNPRLVIVKFDILNNRMVGSAIKHCFHCEINFRLIIIKEPNSDFVCLIHVEVCTLGVVEFDLT